MYCTFGTQYCTCMRPYYRPIKRYEGEAVTNCWRATELPPDYDYEALTGFSFDLNAS
jgi:hypothetical protein